MVHIKFQEWMLREFRDVFGFDRDIRPQKKDKSSERPIKQLDIENVVNTLSEYNLPTRQGIAKFINEVQWGEDQGAIRVRVGTGMNFFIERISVDLEGIPQWITKKIYQVDQTGIGGKEDTIIQEVFDEVKILDEKPMDSAKREFKEIENLVGNMAGKIRRTAKDVFVYEGVRKLEENDYVIRLSVRGHGQLSREGWVVKENQTHVVFDQKKGLIRVVNYDVANQREGRNWVIRPSEVDVYFCPTQSREEISEAIATTLHWF